MRKIRKNSRIIPTGTKFNQLTYLEDLGLIGRNRIARFKCDCGVICEKIVANVTNGKTQTCGHLFEQLNNGNRLRAKKLFEEQTEGFFDYDAYVKSDFILQS